MAYQGGYAGGYGDTLVPPAPADDTGLGWRRIAPQPRETRLRTRTRYRLLIIGTGVIGHADELAVTVGISDERTQHHNGPVATTRIENSAAQAHATRAAYKIWPGGRGTIPDPDEWIVFL